MRSEGEVDHDFQRREANAAKAAAAAAPGITDVESHLVITLDASQDAPAMSDVIRGTGAQT